MILVDFNLCLLINETNEKLDSDLEQKTSAAFERGAAFAKEGNLSDRTYEISKGMNSSLALFNCPVMALQTAHFLETGTIPELPLRNLYIPRPKTIKQLMTEDWSKDLFTNLPENRGFLYLNCSKKTLDELMLDFGKGTHAIVSGNLKYLSRLGHLWNYAVNEDNNGSRNLVILDSYSSYHHQRGVEDPDQYFSAYDPENHWVAIFYEKTPKNVALATLMQDPTISQYL